MFFTFLFGRNPQPQEPGDTVKWESRGAELHSALNHANRTISEQQGDIENLTQEVERLELAQANNNTIAATSESLTIAVNVMLETVIKQMAHALDMPSPSEPKELCDVLSYAKIHNAELESLGDFKETVLALALSNVSITMAEGMQRDTATLLQKIKRDYADLATLRTRYAVEVQSN